MCVCVSRMHVRAPTDREVRQGAQEGWALVYLSALGLWGSSPTIGPLFHGPAGQAMGLTMATSFFSSSSSFSFCFFLPPPLSAVVAAGEYSRPACRKKGEPRESGRMEAGASIPISQQGAQALGVGAMDSKQ